MSLTVPFELELLESTLLLITAAGEGVVYATRCNAHA